MLGSDDEDDHDEAQESAMRAKEEVRNNTVLFIAFFAISIFESYH
jgi:hypothetical protein